MTKEHLRSVRDATPFVPFTIRLADGRSFLIQHRDYLSLPPAEHGGRIAVVYNATGNGFSLVDSLLVTEVTVDGHPAGTNGHSAANQ